MKTKVYFCKHCGYKEIVQNKNNLCPKCYHYMSEQEWNVEENETNWVVKMKAGMRLMMEACEESEIENGTCAECPFSGECGSVDPAYWGKYLIREKENE